ncbi:MAG TPA: metallophosphoesterase [Clostridiales bacterium]|nr:metallophosphoesterase [Clostridiales bacterium]
MRVLVVSDTHGNAYALRRVIESQPDAKIIFHLGDGIRDVDKISDEFPNREFFVVSGNCDFAAFCPETDMKIIENRKIFYTHGHRYNVKSGLYRIACAARERGADIVLFGHTHQPLCEYDGGLYLFNPGSLGSTNPSYGYIDFTPAGVVPQIVELKR